MNIFAILLSLALALVPAPKQELTAQQIDEAKILVEQKHEAIREEARIRAEQKAKAEAEAKKKQQVVVNKTEPETETAGVVEEIITEAENVETEAKMEFIGNYNLTFYCPCSIHCNGDVGYSGKHLTPYRSVAMPNVAMGTTVYVEGSPGYDGFYVVEDKSPGGIIDIFVNHHSEIPGWGTARVKVYRAN